MNKRAACILLVAFALLLCSLACRRQLWPDGAFVVVNDRPIPIEAFLERVEQKKKHWELSRPQSDQEQRLKCQILRQMIIEELIFAYGERKQIIPPDVDIDGSLRGIIPNAELLGKPLVGRLRRSMILNYIISHAIAEKVEVTDEEIQAYISQNRKKFIEPRKALVFEFFFDSQEHIALFMEGAVKTTDFKQLRTYYMDFKLQNPHCDMKALGYVALENTTKMVTRIKDLPPHSFSDIVEKPSGFSAFYIKEKLPARTLSQNQQETKATMLLKRNKQEQEKQKFIVNQLKSSNIKLIIKDDALLDCLESLKRESL